jgi:hypothetical protein
MDNSTRCMTAQERAAQLGSDGPAALSANAWPERRIRVLRQPPPVHRAEEGIEDAAASDHRLTDRPKCG